MRVLQPCQQPREGEGLLYILNLKMKCHLRDVPTRLSPKKQEAAPDTKLEEFSTANYEASPCVACLREQQMSYTDLTVLAATTVDSKADCKLTHDKENKNVSSLHGEEVCDPLDLESSEIDNDSGYTSILNGQCSDLAEAGNDAILAGVTICDTPNRSQGHTPKRLPNRNLPILCFEEVVCSTLKRTSKRNPKVDWHVVDTVVSSGNFGLQNVIGKKMGLDQMDILGELFQRDFKHLVARILRHLSEMDLINVAGVSRTWKNILLNDRWAFPLYFTTLEKLIANNAKLSVHAATRNYALRRAALTAVQKASSPNARSSSKKLPSQGSVLQSRHAEFIQAAKTLKNDESLKVCVQCQSPAKYDVYTQRATCSRESCGFDFCTQCLCGYHFSKDCKSSKSQIHGVQLGPLPGSRKSKQNLRRL